MHLSSISHKLLNTILLNLVPLSLHFILLFVLSLFFYYKADLKMSGDLFPMHI